jgi:hypothetical protein
MKCIVVGIENLQWRGEGVVGAWPHHASYDFCFIWKATQLKPKVEVGCKNLLESSQSLVNL